MLAGINYLAVIVLTFFSMILGSLWYTPVLFGATWMKLVGLKEDEVDSKQAMKGHLFSIVSSFLMVLFVAVLIKNMAIGGILEGIGLGAGLGIFIVVTSVLGTDIYERRPFKLSLINFGYRVVYLIIVGAVLAVW